MKLFLKRFFIFLVCYEVFFFFYPTQVDQVYNEFYEPLEIVIDTMNFSNRLDKKNGFQAYEKGNYRIAEKKLKKAFEMEPNNQAIIYAIGICKMENGDFSSALKFFNEYNPDKRISDIKIWYKTLCRIKSLKNHIRWEYRSSSYASLRYDIEGKLSRSMQETNGKYKELWNQFNSKWGGIYLTDFLEFYSMRETLRRSVYRKTISITKESIGHLKGVENNLDILRKKEYDDSVWNCIKWRFEPPEELQKDSTR